jgi:hypothetical protein
MTPRRLALVVALAGLVSAPARAQHLLNLTPGKFKRGPIAKELNLTPTQIEQAEALAGLMWERAGVAGAEYRKAGGVPEARKTMTEKYREVERAYDKDLSAVLDPAQMKRLREINLQSRGVWAFTDEELRDGLKLTAEQRSRFDELAKAKQARLAEESKRQKEKGRPPVDRETALAQAREATRAEAEAILSILDGGQKKAWAAMIGRPFDPYAP